MRKYCILLFCLLVRQFLAAQTYPWCRDSIPVILDVRASDKIDFDKIGDDPKLAAIIYRVSEGTVIDTSYQRRRKIAKEKGLLWGGYHMFTNRTSMRFQVNQLLRLMNPGTDELISVNFEDPGDGKGNKAKYVIPIDSIFKAIEYVYKAEQRYPVIYLGRSYIKDLIVPFIQKQPANKRQQYIAILGSCPLWCPAIDTNKIRSPEEVLVKLPLKIWESYTLWQFSESNHCTKSPPGTTKQCDCKTSAPLSYPCCFYPSKSIWSDGTDVNVYNGSIQALKNKWPGLK